MKIGLYFGSFNPIHIGHLIIANHCVENENLDEVWFVVSPQNPFKQEHQLLNAQLRLNMVRLAIENTDKLKASNIEFNLPKPSYTINTLIYLEEKYPNHQFEIILGSDGFANIEKWKNSNYIIDKYNFIVYQRPGYVLEKQIKANFKITDSPQIFVSSTHIRELIKKNKSIQFLVPDLVKENIENNGLYK
jgi:nicotinate-nucleotide adenylyltransferase